MDTDLFDLDRPVYGCVEDSKKGSDVRVCITRLPGLPDYTAGATKQHNTKNNNNCSTHFKTTATTTYKILLT